MRNYNYPISAGCFASKLISLLILFTIAIPVCAQRDSPVKWNIYSERITNDEFIITILASIEDPWHIYSQFSDKDGSFPTRFKIVSSPGIQSLGAVEEKSLAVKDYEEVLRIKVLWFEKTAVFTQHVRIVDPVASVTITVEFMACSRNQCLVPEISKLTTIIPSEIRQKKI